MCWKSQRRPPMSLLTKFELNLISGLSANPRKLLNQQRPWNGEISVEYKSDNFNHVHICQVSPQMSCGDTCQIWTWYHTGNHCFDHSEKWENNGTEKIGLVTPTPVVSRTWGVQMMIVSTKFAIDLLNSLPGNARKLLEESEVRKWREFNGA